MSERERSCLSCRRALDLNMSHSSIRRGSSARGRSIGLHGILKMRVTWTSKESTKRELLVPVDLACIILMEICIGIATGYRTTEGILLVGMGQG